MNNLISNIRDGNPNEKTNKDNSNNIINNFIKQHNNHKINTNNEEMELLITDLNNNKLDGDIDNNNEGIHGTKKQIINFNNKDGIDIKNKEEQKNRITSLYKSFNKFCDDDSLSYNKEDLFNESDNSENNISIKTNSSKKNFLEEDKKIEKNKNFNNVQNLIKKLYQKKMMRL